MCGRVCELFSREILQAEGQCAIVPLLFTIVTEANYISVITLKGTHARREISYTTQVFVVVLELRISSAN